MWVFSKASALMPRRWARARSPPRRPPALQDLSEVPLLSAGVSVSEAVTDEEIIDLVHGGQGIFAIALGRVWHDLEGSLLHLPTERAAEERPAPAATDELSARRQARTAG